MTLARGAAGRGKLRGIDVFTWIRLRLTTKIAPLSWVHLLQMKQQAMALLPFQVSRSLIVCVRCRITNYHYGLLGIELMNYHYGPQFLSLSTHLLSPRADKINVNVKSKRVPSCSCRFWNIVHSASISSI